MLRRWLLTGVVMFVALTGCAPDDSQQADGGASSDAPTQMTDEQALASFLDALRGSSDPAVVATADYVDRVEFVDLGLKIVTTYRGGEEDYDVVTSLCASGEQWAEDNDVQVDLVGVADVDDSATLLFCGQD